MSEQEMSKLLEYEAGQIASQLQGGFDPDESSAWQQGYIDATCELHQFQEIYDMCREN